MEQYSQCKMYACNWTELVSLSTSSGSSSLSYSELISMTVECGVQDCQNGWTYDTSIYKSTIVSEVRN